MKRSTPCALFPVFSSAAITPRAWLAVVVGTFANCRPPLEGSCRIRSVNVPPTSQPTMTAPISDYLQLYYNNEYSDAFLVPESRRTGFRSGQTRCRFHRHRVCALSVRG